MASSHVERMTFIRTNLAVAPVAGRKDVLVYGAHPGSRLHRLERLEGRRAALTAPYWSHVWPGGAALAQHFQAAPQVVRGRTVLDLGAGSGIVGIAAAKSGARRAICSEIDPMAKAAIQLNAELNGVEIEIVGDLIGDGAAPADLVAVGDLFYLPELAKKVLAYLRQCREAGNGILIGDIGRAHLPAASLRPLASYSVKDFGDGPTAPEKHGTVYELR